MEELKKMRACLQIKPLISEREGPIASVEVLNESDLRLKAGGFLGSGREYSLVAEQGKYIPNPLASYPMIK